MKQNSLFERGQLQGEECAVGRVLNPAVSLKRRSHEKQNEENCGGEVREVVGVDAGGHAKGTRGFVTRLFEAALENSGVDGSDWEKEGEEACEYQAPQSDKTV